MGDGASAAPVVARAPSSAVVASHAAASANGPPDLTSATGGILPSQSYFEPPVERETRDRS